MFHFSPLLSLIKPKSHLFPRANNPLILNFSLATMLTCIMHHAYIHIPLKFPSIGPTHSNSFSYFLQATIRAMLQSGSSTEPYNVQNGRQKEMHKNKIHIQILTVKSRLQSFINFAATQFLELKYENKESGLTIPILVKSLRLNPTTFLGRISLVFRLTSG
ncbi:hypothetical protein PVL29_004930 [Vitis rotundifolia]|uniref:Uncharacterized protein n=1 Tax=Vitis rotundifolia TaxID=103349 RepID=A0AA39DYY6_VITRO|nr:hypothetical protein PVL29_004930 [Vitis rotundifolia]